jgi:uncharacterized protein (TIGR03084 family)
MSTEVPMQAIVAALGEEHSELGALLDRLDDAGWRKPTRCVGWTVADVVLHLAQTDELALASAQDRFAAGLHALSGGVERQGNVDDGAARLVAEQRGVPNPVLLDRWRTNSNGLRDVLGKSDPHRRVSWVAGQVSAQTLATTRLAECWIHAGDIAAGIGMTQMPTDRLQHIARLAWRTLPYAFAREGRELAGPVAFELSGPSGARWSFLPEAQAVTVIEGAGADLCMVAARRVSAEDTSLRGTGPDADAVLRLVRTYA